MGEPPASPTGSTPPDQAPHRAPRDRGPSRGLAVELVRLRAEDGWPLDAAFVAGTSDLGVVVVHGKTGDFYSGVSRIALEALAAAGYTVVSLNMRCHGLGHGHPGARPPGFMGIPMAGGAWERIADGHKDLRAAVSFLRGQGVGDVALLGHSSGGFYVADYADRDPDIRGFLFSSPLLGNTTAVPRWFPTEAERDQARAHAQALVDRGDGHLLISLPTWYYAISAASLLERMDEPPGRFETSMGATRAPVLMLCGSTETRVEEWEATLGRLPSPLRRFVVIPGADHTFVDHEAEHAAAVVEFLTEIGFPPPAGGGDGRNQAGSLGRAATARVGDSA